MIFGVMIALLAACGGGGDDDIDDVSVLSAPADGGGVAHALAAPARNDPTAGGASVVSTTPGATTPVSAPTQQILPAGSTTALAPALTADFVVAVNGKDRNPGTAAQPMATLQRAIDSAQPGDTILLRTGVYSVKKSVRIAFKKASAALPITIVGETGAILRSAGERFPGVWRGIVEIDKSSHITVKNIAVENSSFFGFRVQDSSNVTLQGNRSTVSLGSGIYARRVKDLNIEGNDISRFCDRNIFGGAPNAGCQEGISLDTVDGFAITENQVHDAPQSAGVGPGGGEGIDVKNGSKNGVVAFNLVWNLVQLGIYVDGSTDGVSNVRVHGNRVWNTYMGIVVASEMGGPVTDIAIHDNIVYNVGVDGIAIANFNGDGLRSRITVHNNTVVNAGIKEAKPPFYARWVSEPFPDRGTGINVATKQVNELSIFNNIVSGSKTVAIRLDPTLQATNRVEANLIWPKTSRGIGNAYDGLRAIVAPPAFVSESTGDWHLTPESPAVGAGLADVEPSVDADRVQRPTGPVDLGALTLGEG